MQNLLKSLRSTTVLSLHRGQEPPRPMVSVVPVVPQTTIRGRGMSMAAERDWKAQGARLFLTS
jgi:hypothetical protein